MKAAIFKKQKKGHQVSKTHLTALQALLGDADLSRDMLIEHLHTIQDHYGHLSDENMVALGTLMRLTPVEVYEVASFYHHFDIVKTGEDAPPAITVRVCESMSCQMAGAEALIHDLTDQYSQGDVRIQRVPCVGACHEAPVAVVGQNRLFKAHTSTVVDAVKNKATQPAVIADALTFDAYCQQGGYALYKQVLAGELDKSDIISTLKDASLRGLGGAGFPTGVKWDIVSKEKGPRFLAVNLDEGEPGTIKDGVYLAQNPHQFLEGMLIAAAVVGCETCYIYLRDEYPSQRELLQRELAKLTQLAAHLPAIHLRRGAGAYICGEESAMIESIEGKRGMPRLRPPFVASVGIFNRPTLVNNFETLYWVPELLKKGSAWFTSHGANGRVGLRSFSVSGRVNKPGVHLAPAGITIQTLIDEYCGGMQAGHEFYGYFPGGASGGILPATMNDIPLDFDTLQPYDCFIGSAAIIVFSNQDSAKALALNAMEFFKHESCGQCTPCSVGTDKACDLMREKQWDQPKLFDLADVMRDASICGLGQAAPNPMLSVIKHFPHEI
ncbi:NAD(P)H-dependent oxidoreductase subunit E [Ostreibacterium oceani]|uniref:NADH-quinone oxidoreductase subunit F n=1 Tax=Ostreibacterium oceani TaxID=2654998 RepID=A0A6N7F0F2_9GAMM|nr:NAD(P)H-dependent oxidoreductase subunit E [Ostreibacterium oceani]MPV86877.1 NADH-quinone oxidoreductase subunit F [Ostreibacterium oceani]